VANVADIQPDAAPVVVADSLCKRYGKNAALSDVSLSLQAGERMALLGHNGAGKTTLLKLFLGVTRPNAGSARFLGHDPTRMPAALRTQWGYLPENVAFHAAMTGREVLRFYARLKRASPKRVADLLLRVGLDEAADRRVGTYSKGMRQRLGLAQALLGSPRVLFLDEPTTGLDPFLRRDLYDVAEERRRTGCAVMICTHTLAEVEERVDKIAILERGRLVVAGTLDECRARAALPTKIRVRTRAGNASALGKALSRSVALDRVNDHSVTVSCSEQDKLQIIARIAEYQRWVEDFEVFPPRLEDLYAHFLGRSVEP